MSNFTERTIRFRGFNQSIGRGATACLEILEKDTWEPHYVSIPILLKPEEAPSETRILEIIQEGIENLTEYSKPYQEFQDKYGGKEITELVMPEDGEIEVSVA